MEPIINPWFFYLVNLLDRVLIVTIIVLIISVIGVVFTLFVLSDSCFDEEEAKTCKKWNKISMIALLISTFMLVATPSKETVYEMIVASYITENNIEAAKDNAKDLVDYIIDKCDEADDKDD